MMWFRKNFLKKIEIIVLLLVCITMGNCQGMIKAFSIKGYENITTNSGPDERDQKLINTAALTIDYLIFYISPQNNNYSFAIMSIKNKTEKSILIKNMEWKHIYHDEVIVDEYKRDDKITETFTLGKLEKRGFEFSTTKQEKDFAIGDKINVVIKFTYVMDGKEYLIDENIEIICSLRNRPLSIP
jgi:hypothetical protein